MCRVEKEEDIENSNRVLAVFETISREDWEAVLYLVISYFEGMDVRPRRPPCGTHTGSK